VVLVRPGQDSLDVPKTRPTSPRPSHRRRRVLARHDSLLTSFGRVGSVEIDQYQHSGQRFLGTRNEDVHFCGELRCHWVDALRLKATLSSRLDVGRDAVLFLILAARLPFAAWSGTAAAQRQHSAAQEDQCVCALVLPLHSVSSFRTAQLQ